MSWWLLLFPFVSALLGWLINSLAVKMLFHPLQPRKILGISIQGVIPKQQKPLAERIGSFAGRDLFSFETIEQKIIDPKNLDKIMPALDRHVDEFLRVKLGKEMPMISMFIGEKTIATMKTIFMQELVDLFPQIMKDLAGNLRSEFNIEEIVKEKIANYPIRKFEIVFNEQLSGEIRSIKFIGAATGFLIGLLQILLILVLSNP